MVRLETLGAAALWLALSGLVSAQPLSYDRYELQYGEPVDVSIADLVGSPGSYDGRAVRTHGRLELDAFGGGRVYLLRDGFGNRVQAVPVAEVAAQFDDQVGRVIGAEVEVVGAYFRPTTESAQQAVGGLGGTIRFWRFLGPPEEEKAGPIEAESLTLEELVTRAGRYDGRSVRVVGQFRGRNLFGDLPVKSQRGRSDWVIKDDVFAVWVTGKKAKGGGFELDAGLKRDTGKWLEVVGRAETRAGVTYLAARQVTLTGAPTPTAKAQAPPPAPERPKLPPMVVFALPLDGETEVPRDSRFVVQFSKDMDENSFAGRVRLLYSGRPQPGDRSFDGLRLSYDGGRRALTVDPGDVLRAGRQLELLLLPGIADMDGLELVPRTGKQALNAVDVFRYRVGL